MTKPLPKVRLKSPLETWFDMICDYQMRKGCCEMTLRLKTGRVRFQLTPDGVWRRRIKRRGGNYWRKATAWDALQCRLSYDSYSSVFPKAPRVRLTAAKRSNSRR